MKMTMISRLDFLKHSNQIVDLYMAAFSGPPYYEDFQPSDIMAMAENLWFSRQDGLVLCCFDGSDRLKGFFAGYNLALEEGICQVVNGDLGCSHNEIFYMAEIAVHHHCRKQGIAFALVQDALQTKKCSYSHFLARTNIGNKASIGLFQKAGFRCCNGAREVVKQNRIDGKVGEDERLFLIHHI